MNQYLLHLIVFTSGAVLMGLEIIGSRVLAPYFGNSIFVWGSLISVVLAALSLGYYWGGRLSTRNPSLVGLLILLIIPGVLIFLLPFIYPQVNHWIANVNFGNRMNPLIASTIYFLPPSIFFGNRFALRRSPQRHGPSHRWQYCRHCLRPVHRGKYLWNPVHRVLSDPHSWSHRDRPLPRPDSHVSFHTLCRDLLPASLQEGSYIFVAGYGIWNYGFHGLG